MFDFESESIRPMDGTYPPAMAPEIEEIIAPFMNALIEKDAQCGLPEGQHGYALVNGAGIELYIELSDLYMLMFSDWYFEYAPTPEDYALAKGDLECILNNTYCLAFLTDKRGIETCLALLVFEPTSEDAARQILHSMYLNPQWEELAIEGFSLQLRYWDSSLDHELHFGPNEITDICKEDDWQIKVVAKSDHVPDLPVQ